MSPHFTEFSLSFSFPVSVEKIYSAWLNGDEHTAMTGGTAKGEAKTGSKFSAWDGYISGKNLELIPNKKIVQVWRTTEFKESDDDSLVEITFKDTNGGCEITLTHSKIPEGQPDYKQGWIEYYFEPMKEYFN